MPATPSPSAPTFRRGDIVVVIKASATTYATGGGSATRDDVRLARVLSVSRDGSAVRAYADLMWPGVDKTPTKVDKHHRGTVVAVGKAVDEAAMLDGIAARRWHDSDDGNGPRPSFASRDEVVDFLRPLLVEV